MEFRLFIEVSTERIFQLDRTLQDKEKTRLCNYLTSKRMIFQLDSTLQDTEKASLGKYLTFKRVSSFPSYQLELAHGWTEFHSSQTRVANSKLVEAEVIIMTSSCSILRP
jgi:hypothetical protein